MAASRRTLLLLLSLALGSLSCDLSPEGRVISGRLESSLGCLIVAESPSDVYEVNAWPDRPPLGSWVKLRVKILTGQASVCMRGPIAEVLHVLEVRTDFRTAPVTGHEVWDAGDEPIVLGLVEVRPGATLTIMPGTTVRLIAFGELRVRGTLIAEGTAADSVRFTGDPVVGPVLAWQAGPVVLDSAAAGTTLRYASVPRLRVVGDLDAMDHLSVIDLFATRGVAALSASVVQDAGASDGILRMRASKARSVGGLSAQLDLEGVTLSNLQLSYSSGSFVGNTFDGLTHLLFQGTSFGTFERNAFLGSTTIELQQDSSPRFTNNDFSADTRVTCDTPGITQCVHMEENWWGTADEAEIRSRVGTCVCFTPWRTGPALPAARP